MGMGDIFIEKDISYKLVLGDAAYVQDIHLNLISTEKIDNDVFNFEKANGNSLRVFY